MAIAHAAPRRRGDDPIPTPTYRRKKGIYEGKVRVGYRDGRPLRRSVYGKTVQEYWEKALKLLGKSSLGLSADPGKITLKVWLEKYVEDRSSELRPSTLDNYRQYLGYVVPELGSVPLSEARSVYIDQFLTRLAHRGLSPSVRRQVYHFLRRAFYRAYQHDLLDRSPMEKLTPPRGGQVRKTGAWSIPEVERALDAAKGTRWYAPIYFALSTGLRPGELFALQWCDIHGPMLQVRRTLLRSGPSAKFGSPKTRNSEREFPLDSNTLALLETHRATVEEERALSRGRWRDFGLVFPSSLGSPVSINNFRRALKDIARTAGIPYRTPHELRHTYITLLRRFADVKLVSIKAGHADTVITDRIYNHPTGEDLIALAVPLERLLSAEGYDK